MGEAVLRIVGVDASLTATGVAIVDPDGSVTLQRVSSKATVKADKAAMLTRFERITRDLRAAIAPGDAEPDLHLAVAIEGPSYGSTGASVHDVAGVWWFIFRMLVDVADAVVVIPPASLKKYVTGKGNAAKDLVLMSIVRQHADLLPGDNNEADALGLAAMVARQLGRPIETRDYVHMGPALATVAWPGLLNHRPGSVSPALSEEGSI